MRQTVLRVLFMEHLTLLQFSLNVIINTSIKHISKYETLDSYMFRFLKNHQQSIYKHLKNSHSLNGKERIKNWFILNDLISLMMISYETKHVETQGFIY
jgi:hypothetical protein